MIWNFKHPNNAHHQCTNIVMRYSLVIALGPQPGIANLPKIQWVDKGSSNRKGKK